MTKTTDKTKKKSKSKKGRVLRVPGGQSQPPVLTASQETGGPEEVTAGFKAGKDLEA
jgi:hypothetical protein